MGKNFFEAHDTWEWFRRTLLNPENKEGFRKNGIFRGQLSRLLLTLDVLIMIYMFVTVYMVWKWLQAFVCPMDTIGFGFSCTKVDGCCNFAKENLDNICR